MSIDYDELSYEAFIGDGVCEIYPNDTAANEQSPLPAMREHVWKFCEQFVGADITEMMLFGPDSSDPAGKNRSLARQAVDMMNDTYPDAPGKEEGKSVTRHPYLRFVMQGNPAPRGNAVPMHTELSDASGEPRTFYFAPNTYKIAVSDVLDAEHGTSLSDVDWRASQALVHPNEFSGLLRVTIPEQVPPREPDMTMYHYS